MAEFNREWKAPVLLVEDNPAEATLFRRTFEEIAGFSGIIVVATAQKAMDYLRGGGEFADRTRFPIPRLLFLDLKLPDATDGFGLIAWIRQEPYIRRLPIIVFTGDRSAIDINRAYDLGINSYLLKPPDYDGLSQLIQTTSCFWALAETPAIVDSV